MKGYIDERGVEHSPCESCLHREKDKNEKPCSICIDAIDRILKLPPAESNYFFYKAEQ
jgi:hypothetical protein